MKAQELRIGNYVMLCFQHKPGWFTAHVTSIIDERTIKTDTQDNKDNKEYYFESIEISGKLLEKCGFERVEYEPKLYGGYHKGQIHINLEKGEFIIVSRIGMSHTISEHCKYLHQLQNLYFALTGNELEIII